MTKQAVAPKSRCCLKHKYKKQEVIFKKHMLSREASVLVCIFVPKKAETRRDLNFFLAKMGSREQQPCVPA